MSVLENYGYGDLATKLDDDMVYGDENTPEHLYVQLKTGNVLDVDINGTTFSSVLPSDFTIKCQDVLRRNILMLFCVMVPKGQRQKGIFTEVLIVAEDIAKRRGVPLCVGPFTEDDSAFIRRVGKHRGYTALPPFCMLSPA